MFSTGAWASDSSGVTTTGLDSVDLWVGGLAEITNLFGGLLGSTFNYVFQTQLENLQDGDRLYYLARTPGMNLRTQLEGNSFAELIQRNTDGTNTLKADAFATADCKFELATSPSPPPGREPEHVRRAAHHRDGVGQRRPATTDCDENQLLLRKPDGTIQYRAVNSVDPVGINGQSVYNGTDGVDRIFGGNDNDTFWGGAGNDIIEGNGGDDVALGGDGNDIITDLVRRRRPEGRPGQRRHRRRHRRRHHDGRRRPGLHQRRRQRQRGVRRSRQRLRHRRPGRRRRVRRRRRRLDRGWLRSGPAPGRPRGAVLRRPGRDASRATTSSSASPARTTTTPRVATTSWRRTRPSTATPAPAASTGPSTSTTPSPPTTT